MRYNLQGWKHLFFKLLFFEEEISLSTFNICRLSCLKILCSFGILYVVLALVTLPGPPEAWWVDDSR